MNKIVVEAKKDNFEDVMGLVQDVLKGRTVSSKFKINIRLAVEEIFVNIASYAYKDKEGNAEIIADVIDDNVLEIVFKDQGVPYNPLKKPDPDITLSAQERPIGGLGIFLVKKIMDEVEYEYKDNSNILIIRKKLEV